MTQGDSNLLHFRRRSTGNSSQSNAPDDARTAPAEPPAADTKRIDPVLGRLMAAWPRLPAHAKETIRGILEAHDVGPPEAR